MPTAAEHREDPATEPFRREVVSFTRRGGRLTERRQEAWDELADRYVLDVPRARTSTSIAEGFTVDPATGVPTCVPTWREPPGKKRSVPSTHR